MSLPGGETMVDNWVAGARWPRPALAIAAVASTGAATTSGVAGDVAPWCMVALAVAVAGRRWAHTTEDRRATLGLLVGMVALLAASNGSAGATAAATTAAAGAIVVAAALSAEVSGREGIDVLIEAALAAGVVGFVARAVGVDLALPDGVDDVTPALQAASLAAGLLGLFAAASLATVSPPGRKQPVLLMVAAATVLAAATMPGVDLGDLTPSTAVIHTLLVAGSAVLALAVASSDGAPTALARRRPAPVTVGRLALIVASVAAGPVTLAGVAAGWTPTPTSASTVPLGALSALGVVHVARLLDQRSHLEYLALHDELTGLPNRVLFVERLEDALAERDRSAPSTAVMFIDIDRFKKVNDSFGHPAGDGLLREVAGRLRGEVRDGDTVARLGGDEFGVVLPRCTHAVAGEVAERMLRVLAEPVAVLGHEVFMGASIGIAMAPSDGHDTLSLLKNADAAMYAAKERGRGRWGLYRREMNSMAEARLDLETALHHAVAANDGLAVHYQPKVDLGTGRIVGAEALVRWHHPSRGLLMPAEFVPMAEDTGLIVALGEWVLMRTCTDVKSWTDAGLAPITVSVNLSARQFEHQPVAEIVAGALRTSGLAPAQLELELTESLALQDSDRVVAVLNDVRALGVACSIDDFGTGYSGLNYLTRFPIDRLKIDRSFVSQIAAGGRDAGLVAAVIAIAHGLGLGVVAEGVETDEQATFLRAHGCDHMQGFLFSRPIGGDEFEQLLRDQGACEAGAGQTPLASVLLLRPASAG